MQLKITWSPNKLKCNTNYSKGLKKNNIYNGNKNSFNELKTTLFHYNKNINLP